MSLSVARAVRAADTRRKVHARSIKVRTTALRKKITRGTKGNDSVNVIRSIRDGR